jgi:hypothetical protein
MEQIIQIAIFAFGERFDPSDWVIRGQGGLIFAAAPSLTIVSMKYKLPDTAAVVSYRTTHLRWYMTDLDSMLQAIFHKEAAETA